MRPIRPWTVVVIVLLAWLAMGGKSPLEWATWWAPGPRIIVVVMESSQVTPQQARLYTAMRASATAGQWRLKGHHVYILDKDQRASADSQAEWLLRWPQWQQYEIPAILIGTPAGRLIYAGRLPESIIEVDALVKRHGG